MKKLSRENQKSQTPLSDYQQKVQALIADKVTPQTFTPKEIADNAFNADLAATILPEAEFDRVMYIYDFYEQSKEQLRFTYSDWQKYSNNIMINFDLIAPLYTFSDLTEKENQAQLEKEKAPFRQKAKALIKNYQFITERWLKLVEDYKETFGLLNNDE